ncbi:hypothetical protein EI94DRAFT_1297803 [Lactarius quietus]|nr:hypothetical protein EI94DRAFT_1297803 [Lactarius quietus]
MENPGVPSNRRGMFDILCSISDGRGSAALTRRRTTDSRATREGARYDDGEVGLPVPSNFGACSIFYLLSATAVARLPRPEALNIFTRHEKMQGTTMANSVLPNDREQNRSSVFCVLSATALTAPASIREGAQEGEAAAPAKPQRERYDRTVAMCLW